MQCVTTGSPEPEVTWYRVQESGHKVALSHWGQVLTLSRVTRSDAGVYRCIAENIVGTPVAATITLDISCKHKLDQFKYPLFVSDVPEITSDSSIVYTGVGHKFYLGCHVTSKPRADIYLTRDNRHVSNKSSRAYQIQKDNNLYYFVNNVAEQDFGEYVCHANNSIGSSRHSIIVVGLLLLLFTY